ncbi:molybdopterin dinucleotide binding domain-containing protein [Varunaivibrio sulfuroxidans]|uniref:Molybdopterin-containing oxidoreductase family iron-sulfur binding subunit n=1 Tax=Varunaivibrio sulfuroxidans TaxID=1773489 RepID=A0A4R3J7Q1_9PROT|nr:molybdopterin dinucleotide binding domain-containing protein [Varunaivibrio sulfuroxidans]TCS60926.1 molybdopterin-containing oxidoreductase family iron-sulfur binding subunit [Varunaivibrio sulfuroxidans]WES31666.1 molybdopterin dinucleotide binding domain-containing protein [Varunaivibrio sulfuroxidans]
MTDANFNRRAFLKTLGLGGVGAALAGCDAPSYVTLEQGRENVVSYLVPEEMAIPGRSVWYASTCRQCPAACGVKGRLREGRVLKLEGHTDSPVNRGTLCQMGQAGLQSHYNPDRITHPLIRKKGKLEPTSWAAAMALIAAKTGPDSGLRGTRAAWLTATVGGHQRALIDAHRGALGGAHHFAVEVTAAAPWRKACRDVLGQADPRIRIDKAGVILSLGADFLGTWISPLHFARQYATFRAAPRGALIQAEPAMSLSGANADLWLAIRPGAEGALAYAVAHALRRDHGIGVSMLPPAIRRNIDNHSPDTAAQITSVPAAKIQRIARALATRGPALVLAGGPALGVKNGYDQAIAAMVLNVILGAVGDAPTSTIEAAATFPYPQLQSRDGNSADLATFAKKAKEKSFDAVFVYEANPLYLAPTSLELDAAFDAIPFKVVLSRFPDETGERADLVLPLRSDLEDWGTHIPPQSGADSVMALQQPLMESLHPETKGFGDILLDLVKSHDKKTYAPFTDYYGYLAAAIGALSPAAAPKSARRTAFWDRARQSATVTLPAVRHPLTTTIPERTIDTPEPEGQTLSLVPTLRQGLWDGRHANLSWLQEAPDQISKVVWDSWAELHPRTARAIGVVEGDYVRVESAAGALEAPVYVYKGVHPGVIAIPLGQGHAAYGRYAQGRGVNPLHILEPRFDGASGELALCATHVHVTKTGKRKTLAKLGGVESQYGRKLVASKSAAEVRKTEGRG